MNKKVRNVLLGFVGLAAMCLLTMAPSTSWFGPGTGDSPGFVTVKLSGLTDTYFPYHVADATGLADSPLIRAGASTVTLSAAQDAAATFNFYADAGDDAADKIALSMSAAGVFSIQPSADSVTGVQILDTDGGTPILNVDTTNERVGIGTAAPDSKLHIEGANVTENTNPMVLRFTDTDGQSAVDQIVGRIEFEGFDASAQGVGSYIQGVAEDISGNQYLSFGTGLSGAAAEHMRITSAGNVGIGTSFPTTKLDQAKFSADALGSYHTFSKSRHATAGSHTVVQDNDVIGGINFAPSDGTDFGTVSAQIKAEVDDAAPAASSIGGALVFSTAVGAGADDLTERMRITKTGYVGIGTDAPTQLLELHCAAGSNVKIALSDDDIAHGMTDLYPTNNFAIIQSLSSTQGGIYVFGMSSADASGARLAGVIGAADPTDTVAAVDIVGYKKNGTTIQALGSTETVLGVNNAAGTNLLVVNGGGKVGIGDTAPTNGGLVVAAGVTIGTDGTNYLIDDASNGAGAATLYIGNDTIAFSFTGKHYYQLGDLDLKTGEAVKLMNRKIYRTTLANDPLCIGIFWGITRFEDSFGTKLIQEKVVFEGTDTPEILDVPKGDALKQVEITEARPTGEVKITYQLDGDTIKSIETPIVEYVETGKFTYQLKRGYSFDAETGKFKKEAIKAKKLKNQELVLTSDNKTKATDKDFAYSVAVLGDSYDEHDKTPLTGAWVTVDAGTISAGDYLTSSSKAGYLEKQVDNVRRNYTVGKAMEAISADTKTGYIYLMQ